MHTRTPPAAIEVPAAATLEQTRARLERVGQGHLLRFFPELAPARQAALLEQINGLDLESVPRLVAEYVRNKPAFELPPAVQPARYYAATGAAASGWDRESYRRKGQDLLRAGKVAAFVVAGGQGSRLGYEGPKGCYPAGAVTNKPLFAIFADAILGAEARYGRPVAWYIMTSPLNHSQTIEFFESNRFFGLDKSNVRFFQQGVLPSLDMETGRVLLSDKGTVATNPDGHGGSLRALWHSGSIADMESRGVEIISYFQVDNPIVNVLDPVFLGLHAAAPDSSAQMSSKMVAKRDAAEKVGVFCSHGAGARAGRVEVLEYSDLPVELSQQTLPDGTLRFCAGSIAVHAIGVEFVRTLNTDPHFRLPLHRAEKKVPHVDITTGSAVSPSANNGVKLEAFVFDALPMCEKSIVLETRRVEEFAPIKNASGADSPESSRRTQTQRAAEWLESAGVKIPRDATGEPECLLEISPLVATGAAELREWASSGKGRLPAEIRRGQSWSV